MAEFQEVVNKFLADLKVTELCNILSPQVQQIKEVPTARINNLRFTTPFEFANLHLKTNNFMPYILQIEAHHGRRFPY